MDTSFLDQSSGPWGDRFRHHFDGPESQPSATKSRGGELDRPSAKPRGASAKTTSGPAQGILTPLVAEDQLFLYHPPPDENRRWSAAAKDTLPASIQAAEAPFRRAFQRIWQRIPLPYRLAVLTYWRDPDHRADFSWFHQEPLLPPCPLIRIVPDEKFEEGAADCQGFAGDLQFRASLLQASTTRLDKVIARTLAQVYRMVNGQHWDTSTRLVEEPYNQWEQGLRRRPSEGRCQQKWDALVMIWRRQEEIDLRAILARWGLADEARA